MRFFLGVIDCICKIIRVSKTKKLIYVKIIIRKIIPRSMENIWNAYLNKNMRKYRIDLLNMKKHGKNSKKPI